MRKPAIDRGLAWAMAMAMALCGSTAGLAHAQTPGVYRIVEPDGRVTFTDKAPGLEPLRDSRRAASPATGATGTTGAPAAALPYALRQIASKYPVTLYSAPDCTPCASGRALLTGRGIPFTERTVTTADDQAALQRLMGDSALPYLSIGGQRIKGFSDAEWSQTLDAAGYPRSSALPVGYRGAPALPLVTVQKTEPAPASTLPSAPPSDVAEPSTPASPRTATPANPAGIRF